MADVFFSYARDDRPTVDRLDEAFRARGWTTWFDRHIRPGDRFRATIQKEIEAATAVVVLWSVRSVDAEWVHNEAELARKLGLLVPVVLDGSQPPLGFLERNAISLAGWNGTVKSAAYDDLVSAIAMRIAARTPRASSTTHEVPALLPDQADPLDLKRLIVDDVFSRGKRWLRAPVLEKSPTGLLSWKPVGGALTYVVERDRHSAFRFAEEVQRDDRLWCATIAPDSDKARLPLVFRVSFHYRVKAIGQNLESEWSNTVQVP